MLSWQLRKSLRYLMSNLQDFEPSRDVLSYSSLQIIDQYMLHLLQKFLLQVYLAVFLVAWKTATVLCDIALMFYLLLYGKLSCTNSN